MHFDRDHIRAAMRGRVTDVLRDVAGIPAGILDGKHHPCPKCGGKDRFRLIDQDDGAVLCNQCFSEQNGDCIAAVQWMRECSFGEALSLIGEYLEVPAEGVRSSGTKEASSCESMWKLDHTYYYTDKDGNQAYKVERYKNTAGGKHSKKFLQFSFFNGNWKAGIFDTPGAAIGTPKRIPYPYNYPRLMNDEVKTLFIVEGEKCAERLQAVLDAVDQPGQYAVSTLAGGANMMGYWGEYAQELTELNVYIIPDNDKPGRDGASAALENLDRSGIEAMVIPFEGKPDKFDVADWIDGQQTAGLSDKEIGEIFLKTLPARGRDGIEWVDGLDEIDTESENKPNFLGYLPEFFRDLCEEVGKHFGFDGTVPAYVGLSVASVAMAHQTVFAHGYYYAKPALLHTIVVAPSGTGKSPMIQDEMLLPLREIYDLEYEQLMIQQRNQIENAATEKERKKLQAAPARTIRKLIEQPTTEAILMTFDLIEKAHWDGVQKRGVCLFYDEGKQLIEGLDAYHNKAKQDLSILLSLMDGRGSGALRVDTERDRYFKDPRLVLIAGVQNSVIKRCISGKPEYFEEGFFQRVNLIVPALLPCTYETQMANEKYSAAKTAYGIKIREIYNKKHYHKFYTLNRDAEGKYQNYEREVIALTNGIKAQGVENLSKTDEINLSLLNKSKQRVLEAALVFQVLLDVETEKIITEDNDTKGKITATAVEGAICFVRHSHKEFHKLVELSRESKEQDLEGRIVNAINGAGNEGITRRDLQRRYFPGHGKTKIDTVGEYMARLMSRNPGIKEGTRQGRGKASTYYYLDQSP